MGEGRRGGEKKGGAEKMLNKINKKQRKKENVRRQHKTSSGRAEIHK